MSKSKLNNTSNEDLDKIKKISTQCYNDAKNTLDKITKFRQSNVHQIRLNNSSKAFKNYYETYLLSRDNYKKAESSYQKVMTLIEEIQKFVKDEKTSLTKNIQACLKEIDTCSNLFTSEQQHIKEAHLHYQQEKDSRNKCGEYLSLIYQSLLIQSEKLQKVQTILPRIQQKKSSKYKTGMNSDQVDKSNNLSQDQKQVLKKIKNILGKIMTQMDTFCTKLFPKISSYKLKQNFQQLSIFSACSQMLKIIVDILNSDYKISGLLNFSNTLRKGIADCSIFYEQIAKKKFLLDQEMNQIRNHFNHILVEFYKINQQLNGIKKLLNINQQIWDILESCADIKIVLDPILTERNINNTRDEFCCLKFQLFLRIRDKNTDIQQKTLKLLNQIRKKEQDYCGVDDTVKIQTLYYTRTQVDKEVKIKLDGFREKLQVTHQKQKQELKSKYNQQIQQLQNQINALQQKLDSKFQKLKNQQLQNSAKLTKLDQLLQAENTISGEQSRQLQQLTNQYNNLKPSITYLKEKNSKLASENKSYVQKVDSLNQQVVQLNKRIFELSKERDIAKRSQQQAEMKLKEQNKKTIQELSSHEIKQLQVVKKDQNAKLCQQSKPRNIDEASRNKGKIEYIQLNIEKRFSQQRQSISQQPKFRQDLHVEYSFKFAHLFSQKNQQLNQQQFVDGSNVEISMVSVNGSQNTIMKEIQFIQLVSTIQKLTSWIESQKRNNNFLLNAEGKVNNQRRQLEEKLERNAKQSALIKQYQQHAKDEIAKQRAQFDKEKLKSQRYCQLLQVKLVKQYEQQIQSFQDRANKETQKLTKQLDSLNKKTAEDLDESNKKYQQALNSSQHNSACLKMIYRAMTKLNEVYNKQSTQKQSKLQKKPTSQQKYAQKYFYESEQKINLRENQQQVLTEEEGKHVIAYAIKTLKVMESVIQLRDQKNQTNLPQTTQQDENKLREMIKDIDERNKTDNLGQMLKSNLIKGIIVSKGQSLNSNSIEKLQLSFSTFVKKIAEFSQLKQKELEKINKVTNEKNKQVTNLKKELSLKESTTIEYVKAIQLKEEKIQKINKEFLKAQSQLGSSQKLAYQNHLNLQNLRRQNQLLKKQKQQSLLQKEAQCRKNQQLQEQVRVKKIQINQLSSQLLIFEQKGNKLQATLKEQKENLNKNLLQLQQQKKSSEYELNKKTQELTEIKSQLQLKTNLLKQNEGILNQTEKQLSILQTASSTNSQKITQLKQLLDKQINQKNAMQTILQTRKSQYHNQLTALNFKVDELNTSLVQNQGELSQSKQQLSQLKEIFTNVSSVLEKKINKKELKLDELVDVIQNYNPPVGMKLIISHIIHGQDQQRSQIIAAIEKFSKKTIKRTDLLCRYPDAKSILHHFKNANNFAFIVLYKTVKGTIFGSYSEGLRKKTFIFSFTPSGQNNITEVQFYIPENPSAKITSVELSQSRYLQYGAGQLRLNCLELATITARSDVNGGGYYGLNWREVMNEDNEENVPFCELELHKVQFEVKSNQ